MTSMKILIATGNQGKFNEIMHALHNLPYTLLSLQDVDLVIPEEVEDGDTYEENAYKKAYYCARKTGYVTLADDSGLIVDALKDELGVFTRRWGVGADATDKEWLDYFMQTMEDKKDRSAMFVSCLCLVDSQGNIITTARGESKGVITKTIEAPIKPGIPLSSVFKVEGYSKVHSALPIEEKNKISHRGKSLRQLKEYLSRCPLEVQE